MYSDPTGELQERLGMTLRTLDPGSAAEKGYISVAFAPQMGASPDLDFCV